MALVEILPQRLVSDAAQVVVRPYPHFFGARALDPSVEARVRRVAGALGQLDSRTLQAELDLLLDHFGSRHREVSAFFCRRFDEVAAEIGLEDPRRESERALLGAFLCHEYAFEAAAVMNPSAVPHPDQSGLAPGELRIVLSLRTVGEGHVSTISFREAVFTDGGELRLQPDSRHAVAARPAYGGDGIVTMTCEAECALQETVLFPATPAQRHGLEDLRLTLFEDGGERMYCGTYTAYSGTDIASELLVTQDFRRFDLHPLQGQAALSKGMALFPRRIGGRYAMIGRQDNENQYLLYSEDLFTWQEGARLAAPVYPWELLQVGNCGAPIELAEGWLVLTHGVGAMRKYAIGAMLLDKGDPLRVLGRSRVPLLSPLDAGAVGYVPNVVYSCGGLVHAGRLFLPFGIADSTVGFATIPVGRLLDTLA